MSAHTSELVTGEQEARARLSTVDRFLPVWIVAAMAGLAWLGEEAEIESNRIGSFIAILEYLYILFGSS